MVRRSTICRTYLQQEGLTPFLFLCYNVLVATLHMEKDKLKLIVKNLELLVEALKSEVYSDTAAYKIGLQQDEKKFGFDYSENDDDGYPD